MKRKKILFMGMFVFLAMAISACASTDVIGKFAKSSFQTLVEENKNMVFFDDKWQSWSIASPDGEKFLWSRDFSATNPDVALEINGKPFIDAGLDVSKLPKEQYKYDAVSGKLYILSEISEEKFNYSGEPTPSASFRLIVDKNRNSIGYHVKLDHYGIKIGDGHKFEWAKDMTKNDKDIVFILNPQPLIEAGVDPMKVTGWIFTKIEDMDKELDVFLKPFNLK